MTDQVVEIGDSKHQTGVASFVGKQTDAAGQLELPGRTLFIGMGDTAVGWYRCYLPALTLGADWIGVAGEWPALRYITGLVGGNTVMPLLEDYDVVVLQQPRGEGWRKTIRGLQSRGITVLFEVDDYLHAIGKMPGHDFREHFGAKDIAGLERNMRIADGVIVSTPYLARKYAKFNERVFVCPNGIDVGRYNLTRPARETCTIGWAGATGHWRAFAPWGRQVGVVMRDHPGVCFVSIGQPFAEALEEHFPGRTISVPFTLTDTYPAAMTLMDVALAPAGKGQFFRGKSDLRWVEAGALGIPVIADPEVYPDIVHGVTGFHAASPQEAGHLMRELVLDPQLRIAVGEAAREEIRATRDMRVTSQAWARAFTEMRMGR